MAEARQINGFVEQFHADELAAFGKRHLVNGPPIVMG